MHFTSADVALEMTWSLKGRFTSFCIWISSSEKCLLNYYRELTEPKMPSIFFRSCFLSILTCFGWGVGQSLILCSINISTWPQPSHFTFQDSYPFEKCIDILRAKSRWNKVSKKSKSFVTIWSKNRLTIWEMI